MAHEIIVPEVSEGVTEGTVVAISVAVGDQVEKDQPLLELETEKAVIAIPSPDKGRITEIKVAEGDTVEIGATIMLLEGDGKEEAPEPEAKAEADQTSVTEEAPAPEPEKASEAETPEEPAKETSPEPRQPPRRPSRSEFPPSPTAADMRASKPGEAGGGEMVPPAAPSTRRLARELGVDIYQVQGSGPGGRISETDVREFVRTTMQRITGGGPQPAAQGEFAGLHAQRPLPDFSKWGKVEREPLSRVREVTADAMSYTWSTVPMVTQYDQARIGGIEDFRRKFNTSKSNTVKLTMTAILVKVCAVALKTFPQFNSSLDLASRELILKRYVHIGVAVDTPHGLLVPVLRDADHKGIEELAGDLDEIASRARERKLNPAEMEGGSFTISNLGGIGGTAFTPLVYAPQVAILGVSRAKTQPIWNGDEFRPELVMPLSLSYDHRVIDGADGARFLRWICEVIENPLQLVMTS